MSDNPWGPTLRPHAKTIEAIGELTDAEARDLIRKWYPDVADRIFALIDQFPELPQRPPPPRPDSGDPYGDPMWGETMRSFDAWWERRFGRRRRGDYRGPV